MPTGSAHRPVTQATTPAQRGLFLLEGPLGCVMVAIVALVAHATTLWGGFVWLDHAHLGEGLAIAQPGSWLSLFERGFAGTGYYRPLMALSLSVDAAVGGGGAALYHVVTLGWHAAAAVMTLVAAQALALSRRAALVAGLLFAVHPTGSLVAGAIAFRSESMLTVALLALIVFHVRHKPIAAAAALLAGALTKETALVLGPLFILALVCGQRRTGSSSADDRQTRRRLLLAEAGALGAAIALRMTFAPGWRATFADLSGGDGIGTRLAAFTKSAGSLTAPIDRTVCDAFPVVSWTDGRAIVGLLLIAGLVLFAWRRRGPALLFTLALLPSLNLMPLTRWWSPHYLYVPLAFATMLAAQAAMHLPRRAWLTVVVAVPLLAGLSLQDGRRYRSDETLWAPELAARADCREGHFYLARHHHERADWPLAAQHYERAVATTPGVLAYVDRASALQNLGVVRIEMGELEAARAAFESAVSASSDALTRRKLTHNLATLALRTKKPDETARLLEKEVARPDAFPESLLVRAKALRDLGREQEAMDLIRRLRALR